jgi:DnaJ-class molecular chaperone
MVHFEVVLRPNFESQDHYEVLGCTFSSTQEELTDAYRHLSWKYHPENQPDDPEAMKIFVRLSEAYYALVIGKHKTTFRQRMVTLTANDAKKAYEKRFGRFRKLSFVEAGIFGIPYGFALKEQLKAEDKPRGQLECGRIKVGFFRAFSLKLKLDGVLGLMEVLLTAGTIGACKFIVHVVFWSYRLHSCYL